MPEHLAAELERFAIALQEAQQCLLTVLRTKRAALAGSDATALAALQEPELEAARRLQTLVTWRGRLLERARNDGHSCETLIDLAGALGPSANIVTARLRESRQLAAEIRHESWVQWVITNRCCNFYSELLELIAQGGRKPATYHDTNPHRSTAALLDAKA
jgi:hypothetical protein